MSNIQTEIREITFTRNDKRVTMEIRIRYNDGVGGWIRKSNGKPFYGTTGYLDYNGKGIHTYAGKMLAYDVEGLEDLSNDGRNIAKGNNYIVGDIEKGGRLKKLMSLEEAQHVANINKNSGWGFYTYEEWSAKHGA